jgi:CHASE2 domain-containing sensor protein
MNIREGLRAVLYFWVVTTTLLGLGYGYFLLAALWPFTMLLIAVVAVGIWVSALIYHLNS